jgi:amino-acid N-acetyltransferase
VLRAWVLRVSERAGAVVSAPVMRGATARDREQVHALLAACALPVAGVDETTLGRFIVAERAGAIVGVAGLELYGSDALLRSVAVSPTLRQAGLGGALAERLLGQAASLGVRRVYLLTTTAESFFARRGFTRTDRSAVGADLLDSVEFRDACPSTATVMVREL